MTRMAVTASRRTRGVRVSAVIAAAATFAAYGAVFGTALPASADPILTTFALTGSPQRFTVPAKVYSVTVSLAAGSGGSDQWGHAGGSGGEVTAVVPVKPGEVLSIVVGGKGSDGSTGAASAGGYGGGGASGSGAGAPLGIAGGGGGGGSFVFDVSTIPNRLLVAAGGGGGTSGFGLVGGAGGSDGDASPAARAPELSPGDPGTSTGGGAGGTLTVGSSPYYPGAAGTGPGSTPTALGEGGMGSAGSETENGVVSAGGGGGGYYGGGGGGSDSTGYYASGGGGGSGFLIASATKVSTGTNSGDGFVTISYTPVVAPVRPQNRPLQPFIDVPEGVPFASAINALHEAGVVNGYPGDLYKPRATLSRAAAAAFLYRQAHPGSADAPAPATAPFADVPVTAKFAGDIAWLRSRHIATGYASGGFRPDALVSRAALSAFLYRRAHPGRTPAEPAAAPFRDVAVDARFAGDIAWAKAGGTTNGYQDGTFRPGNPITRQAAAAFLYRFTAND